ncbi:hypothetical protein PO124_23800 [Bacillus licheniformis]|nr:hypothetical protein [Bacillus licheniformis]
MLGMFVSTIPMKASIEVHQDFSAFVQERMKDQLKSFGIKVSVQSAD